MEALQQRCLQKLQPERECQPQSPAEVVDSTRANLLLLHWPQSTCRHCLSCVCHSSAVCRECEWSHSLRPSRDVRMSRRAPNHRAPHRWSRPAAVCALWRQWTPDAMRVLRMMTRQAQRLRLQQRRQQIVLQLTQLTTSVVRILRARTRGARQPDGQGPAGHPRLPLSGARALSEWWGSVAQRCCWPSVMESRLKKDCAHRQSLRACRQM